MYKKGDKVVFIDTQAHERAPHYFPIVGAVGVVDHKDTAMCIWVQWPAGSTSNDDLWCTVTSRIKPYKEGFPA